MPRFMLSTLIVGLWLACAIPAAAQSENYPGIGCQPIGAPQQAIAASRVSEFYIVNLSQTPQAFVCPIVADLHNGDKNVVWVQVFASARTTESFSCDVFGTITRSGAAPTRVGRVQRARNGAGPNLPVLLFLELIIPDTVPAEPREYSLVCQLPTGGRLWRYWVSVFAG